MNGEHVKKKLDEKGISAQSLSSLSGICEDKINDILQSENVEPETLEKIAKSVGEPVNYFEAGSKPNIVDVDMGDNNSVGSGNHSSNEVVMKLLDMIDKRDALIEKLMNKLLKD